MKPLKDNIEGYNKDCLRSILKHLPQFRRPVVEEHWLLPDQAPEEDYGQQQGDLIESSLFACQEHSDEENDCKDNDSQYENIVVTTPKPPFQQVPILSSANTEPPRKPPPLSPPKPTTWGKPHRKSFLFLTDLCAEPPPLHISLPSPLPPLPSARERLSLRKGLFFPTSLIAEPSFLHTSLCPPPSPPPQSPPWGRPSTRKNFLLLAGFIPKPPPLRTSLCPPPPPQALAREKPSDRPPRKGLLFLTSLIAEPSPLHTSLCLPPSPPSPQPPAWGNPFDKPPRKGLLFLTSLIPEPPPLRAFPDPLTPQPPASERHSDKPPRKGLLFLTGLIAELCTSLCSPSSPLPYQPPTRERPSDKRIQGRSFLSAVMLVFQFLVLPSAAQVGVFPIKAVAGLGSHTVVSCVSLSSVTSSVEWRLNGTSLNELELDVTQDHSVLQLRNVTAELNNSNIQCIADTVPSSNATLLVQGQLAAVGSLLVDSSVNHTYVNWTAPFTLDITTTLVDITYCVDVVSFTSSATLHSECGITETEFTYPLPSRSGCDEYNITVTPVNVVGNGTENFKFFQVRSGLKLKDLNVTTANAITEFVFIMTSPVCSATVTLHNFYDEEPNITVRNTQLTVSGMIITDSLSLTLNSLYYVILSASNIHDNVSSKSMISTFDIMDCSVYQLGENIAILVNFVQHTEATGALLNFIYINEDSTIDFSMSFCQTIEKNGDAQNVTLSLNVTYPGDYVVYAYDIERNMQIVDGPNNYQASTCNFSVSGGQEEIASSSPPQKDICSVHDSNHVIFVECLHALFSKFQVIAQINDSSEVNILHVNSSSQSTASVEVPENGRYLVTVLPIQDGKGILSDVAFSYIHTVTEGTFISTTTTTTYRKPSESLNSIVIVVPLCLVMAAVLVVIVSLIMMKYHKKRKRKLRVLSRPNPHNEEAAYVQNNIPSLPLEPSLSTTLSTPQQQPPSSFTAEADLTANISLYSLTNRPYEDVALNFPPSSDQKTASTLPPTASSTTDQLKKTRLMTPSIAIVRSLPTSQKDGDGEAHSHSSASSGYSSGGTPTSATPLIEKPEETLAAKFMASATNTPLHNTHLSDEQQTKGTDKSSDVSHYAVLDQHAKPADCDDVIDVQKIEYAIPNSYKTENDQTYAILAGLKENDRGRAHEISKDINGSIIYAEVVQPKEPGSASPEVKEEEFSA